MKGAKLILLLTILLVSVLATATPQSLGDIEIVNLNPSNPDFVGDKGDSFQGSFDVHNKGSTTRTITLVTDPNPTTFNVVFSTNNFNLGGGVTQAITYTINTDSSDPLGVTLFDIYATDNLDPSHQDFFEVSVDLSEEDKLEFSKVDFDGQNLDPGEIIVTGPMEVIDIEVELKNLFSDDTRIEDITTELVIKDFIDESRDDLELSFTEVSLDGNEKASRKISFDVPLDAVDGRRYDFTITAEGRDEHGVKHTATISGKIEIEKDQDDVRFSRLDIGPLVVECNREITFNIEVANFGSNDQKDAAYSLRSEELGINVREDFELSNDAGDIDYTYNSVKRATVAFSVVPGKYNLFARTFYDHNDESDEERIVIEVKQCTQSSVQPPVNPPQNNVDNQDEQNVDVNQNNDVVVDNVDETVSNNVNNNGGIESVELPSIFDNKKVVILMIILIIIIALLIILGLYYVMM